MLPDCRKRSIVTVAHLISGCALLFLEGWGLRPVVANSAIRVMPSAPELQIQSTSVRYLQDLDLLIFEQQLNGSVGSVPQPIGQMDGAAVLAYVFPTTLKPEDVGFGPTEGVIALAITSHPDFDDTPLWDENNDRDYANDGQNWHSHWVVLATDELVAGGLSVEESTEGDPDDLLPPTNPGLPMFIDSPGFEVLIQDNVLQVLVPAQRVNHVTNFTFDAVTAYMQVNTSDGDRPLLGVYEVYSVGSGDLSLPFSVQTTTGEDN